MMVIKGKKLCRKNEKTVMEVGQIIAGPFLYFILFLFFGPHVLYS